MNNFISFQIHGNADHGGTADLLSGVLVFMESLVGKGPEELFATVLPGVAAMANIHPLLVHFPIAFFTGFFFLDLLGSWLNKQQWRQIAGFLLYLGTFAAVFTVAAGLWAAETVAHGHDVHDIMENHEHIGLSILGLAAILSVWRVWLGVKQGVANGLFLLLAALLWGMLAIGADFGGLMVYKYGVAVQAVAIPEGGYHHEHDAAD